jgi:AraC family transcriptional regulator, transcriptional activator of pobA
MAPVIPSYSLDRNYHFIHKEAVGDSDFGLDSRPDLIEGGFGIYSSARVRDRIGPLKSEFFRLAICLEGSVTVECGLEQFHHQRHTIHFNFPSQLFSLYDKSPDMRSYYILFTPQFVEDFLPLEALHGRFEFLDYSGVPFFQLDEDEAAQIIGFFQAINQEILRGHPTLKPVIQSYLHLIFLTAQRSYLRQQLGAAMQVTRVNSLVTRFKKLVGQHFREVRSVGEYASLLAVTPNHLSKAIKELSGKTPGEWIDEMVLMEAKALLRHSELSISEVAYQLNFSDPSHFNKFFKKLAATTPSQYRLRP